MKNILILVFSVLIASHCVAGSPVEAEHDVTTQDPAPTTTKPTKPTTTPPSTTSSTTTTTTVTPPTTKTTPSTTSTTTTKPTTPTKPTTTTPTVPSTTTSPPPLPPKPQDPEEGTWELKIPDTNNTCVILHFAMQLQIPYTHSINGSVNATVNIPKDAAVVSGDCTKPTDANIMLEWMNAENETDHLVFHFWKNETKYYLNNMELLIRPDSVNFPGSQNKNPIMLNLVHPEFETTVNKSYKCDKREDFNLTNEAGNTTLGWLQLSHLQLQAFGNSSTHTFDSAEDCAPFDTPDIVPIAVGCALALLVIIVLIAYLVGRRRRQARGYLSMFTETKNESDYIPMKNLSCFQ